MPTDINMEIKKDQYLSRSVCIGTNIYEFRLIVIPIVSS